MSATPESPKSEGERLLDLLDPAEAEAVRREVRAEIVRESEKDMEQEAIPPTITGEEALAGHRADRDRTRKEFEDRLLLERSGAPISQGASSRTLLKLLLQHERRIEATEKAIARRREWKVKTDEIAEARRTFDTLPWEPRRPKIVALVHLRELEYAAGVLPKRLLREAQEQLADL